MKIFFASLTAIVGIIMLLGYYPQAWRIIKTHSAEDISLLTYTIFAIGTVVWTAYGFYIHDMVIILSFIVGVVGSWSVLLLSLKYKKKIQS